LEGFSLPVIEARCEYKQPAVYDDELEVRTSAALISAVRLQFTYEIVRASDGVTLATGHTIHASLGRDGRPRRPPERVRELLT
jgi:acyl-CoA thioester hydrolase